MSATTSGALKAHIETLGLSVTAFRDAVPDGQALPAISVQEGISYTLGRDGDTSDPDKAQTVDEFAQVDLWQPWRTAEGRPGERYGLHDALVAGLHGARLSTAPTVVYGILVVSSVRLVERAANVVHHAITVSVRRVL